MDYLLILGSAADRSLRCAVCGADRAPHLLAATPEASRGHERDKALCDLHASGLQENSGVSEEDLQRLRGGTAPESWD